jgi:hypothetical protein
MPPRRSGRASLPTPAHSVKTESVVSTPSTAPPKRARVGKAGIPITPSSLTDGDEDGGVNGDNDEGMDILDMKVEDDVKSDGGNEKRIGE